MIKKIWYKLHLDKYYGVLSSFFDIKFKKKLNIYDVDKTVRYIKKTKCSVARYGDGELHIAQEGCSIGFQDANKELQKRLKEILLCNNDNVLICLPSAINDYSYMTEEAIEVWKKDLKYNRHYWLKLINKTRYYGDTQFTRPYIDYKDKTKSQERFQNIREIWKDRKVLLVEGHKSRLGVNNNLFSEVKELKRILAPSENAFSKYDYIISEVKNFSKEYLLLIALGPTATVLAYDLALFGYQAIDIGHLDIEYEWCKLGVYKKVAIKGKYTNESNEKQDIGIENDKEYLSQIVERIE